MDSNSIIQMIPTSLEGRIIEFLDSEELKLGYVRKYERDRLQVVDPRGRNLSIQSDRVVVVHGWSDEPSFPLLARQIAEKIQNRQSDVDVELLWQALTGKHQEFESKDLAELFFGDQSPESISAIFRAVSQDSLFFKRKGAGFIAKTDDQVSTERVRRQRESERKAFRDHAARLISAMLKRNSPFTPEMLPIIDRIQNWMKHRTGDEVGNILEELAGAAKARDAAYDILLRAGRIDANADRFLAVFGIEEHFSKPVLEAADLVSEYLHEESRVDYRSLAAITIDDEDTSEVDDALTLDRSANETIVGIHIADVSAFVSKGDLLDAEAGRRSSTIYLPTLSVPMFPDRLSTDLFSLTPNTDRPAFTVEVRFDEHGVRVGYRIVRSTIRVQKRLSYDQADAAIKAGDPCLQDFLHLAGLLQKSRGERGAITFRRPELKIRVKEGEIHIKQIDPRSPSRLLVSEMMILANGLAADFAAANSLPVIFRTQEPREAIDIEDAPVVEAIAFERLRKTFKRSRLSLTPGAHSGLGLSAYTQASSPIRRYADLVTQRQFTALLRGSVIPYSRDEVLRVLTSAEAAEQEIRVLEERSTNYWLLEYLARYKRNEPLSAVTLDTKGNIELEDYYLRGKIAAPNKRPGETIQVMIDSINPEKGEVRFKVHVQ